MANLISKIKAPNNTEYLLKDSTLTAGTGISISGHNTDTGARTITNTGVRAISTGSTNGTISVNTNGQSANVSVKGLGTAAYTSKDDYAAANSAVTIAGKKISLGGSLSAADLVTALGLSSAMRYKGSLTELPAATNANTYATYAAGDVVTISSDGKEYVYNKGANAAGSSWVELGGESAYKKVQKAVNDPSANGTSTSFIKTIEQDTEGVITAQKASLPTASTSAAGIMKVGTGLSVSSGTVNVSYGTAANTACQGNDSRLSNARTPTSHTHGNLTNDGKITTTATIANGDKLVIVDSDTTAASKITGSNITFDGSTTTKALTPKGTWETFVKSQYTLPAATTSALGGIKLSSASNTTPIGSLTVPIGTLASDGLTYAYTPVAGTDMSGNNTPLGMIQPDKGFVQETTVVSGVELPRVGVWSVATMGGATSSADGTFGAPPSPKKGDQAKFLRGDATWQSVITAHRTYTAFTGKPAANATPGFGESFTISQIAQSTTGQVSGTDRTVTIPALPTASTSAQGVVQLSDATNSTSTTLAATANAVKKAYDLANGKTANTGTVTKVSTGAGLTGGDITTTGTVKANLTSETKLTNAAADGTETSGRVYPVRLDKNGKLAVNVPWTNVNSSYLTSSSNLNADKLSSGTVPVARLPDASTSAQGVVQLSDATNSTSTTLAATANAVKKAYDLANGKTANTGTVTSVKLIQGNNITINSSGTAITTSGERTISLSSVQQPLVAASSTAATQTSPYKPSLWAFNLGVAASSLATGMLVTVKIPVATTNYGSFISIDNGTTYKPIAVGTAKARLTTQYSVDDVVTLFYDASGVVTTYALAGASNTADISGGCWRVLNYYDSGNSNDTATMYIRHNHGTFAPTTALYAYELCLQSFVDNAKLIPVNTTQKSTANSKTTITTAEFDPFADIIYYSRDATVNANTNIGVSYLWLAYSLIDLRYSFNTASTLTANKDVYIVAKMQDNGSAKLRNPGATGSNAAATATGANAGPITQTLPTSDDGYIYIKLGRAYDSYRCSTDYHHQIYWYKNGKVRIYPDMGCPITKYGPSSAFSSLPVTFEDDSITPDMVVLNYVLSNPTAQINNWTVTTAAGSLTISGQVQGSTTITLYLGRCEQEA